MLIVSTERIAGWGIEGAIKGVVAAGKLAEVAKGARAASKLATKNAAELRAAASALKAAKGGMSAKRAAKAEDEISLLNKAAREQDEMARQGTSMANRADDYALKAANEARKPGCFVAGTPVWMSDGLTKPIEQIKIGDLVLSKNEKTGEIAQKRVTNVSVRADIWTRKLTFDNGAVLETTDEHPLYVEGSGFVKAKEVGIGSSIVTRAGPSAKVVSVQADVRQATVYNFTVDEFHTYFVGDAALWVHNVDDCLAKLPDERSVNWNPQEQKLDPVVIYNYNNGVKGNAITDLDKVIVQGDKNYVISQKSLDNMPPNPKEWTDIHVLGKPNKYGNTVDTGLPGYLAALRSGSRDLPSAVSNTNDLVTGKTILVFEVTGRSLDFEVEASIIKAVEQFAAQNRGVTVQVRFPWMV